MSKPTLGYWACQARAGYIRLLLAHLGVDYEDKQYNFADRAAWAEDKAKLPADFPNLPYWQDDEVGTLTQSHVILRYLGRKNGMDGTSISEQTRQDLAEQEVYDIYQSIVMAGIADVRDPTPEPRFPKLRAALLESLPARLAALDKFLGTGQWVLGSKLTWVDFRVYSTIILVDQFEASLLDKTPNLKSFIERIHQLPGVKKYRESAEYKAIPDFPALFPFGGKTY